MAGQESVADPLRAKRPHPESADISGNDAAVASSATDQASKRIKVENGEANSKPLQKAPGPPPNPPNTKPPAAVKQEETISVPSATKETGAAALMPSAPISQVSSSAAQPKPAAVPKPQALPQPAAKPSVPIPHNTTAPTSTRATSVPLTPAPPSAAPTSTGHAPQKESPPPLKVTTFRHLHRKYGPELDYMLVEFKRLERQLLGAPSHQANPPKPESTASRERREKLHVFIIHIEDTVRQVEEGLALEKQEEEAAAQAVLDAVDLPTIDTGTGTTKPQIKSEEEKKSSETSLQQPQPNPQPNATIEKEESKESTTTTTEGITPKFTAAEASLSSLPPEKEREESVQRLEEHILANLLPVKVRLTKQLAAQKGATRNPLTAPVRAGAPAATTGGTIAEAVEAKRKAQEEELLKRQLQQRHNGPSQYGKPIGAAGSSLTNRLHGSVLGSGTSPSNGDGTKRTILYAGVAPGSTQVSSSVSAVTGAHPDMVGKDATKALSMAEEERRRLKALEENATRVALGGAAQPPAALDHRKPAALPKQPEGPATLAARARAIALAGANGGGASKISRPNQQFPTRAMQQHRPQIGAAALAGRAGAPTQYVKPPYQPVPVPAVPTKPKKPHVKPNFDDPALSPEQQFELRMQEARWRQRKRRRERRRKRIEMYCNVGSYHAVPVPIQQQSLPPPPQSTETQPEPIKSAAPPPAAPAHPPANTSQPPQTIQARPKKAEVFGPRTVEYVCAVCNETYVSTCEFNPWWALSSHECPKCGKIQIPKLDISIPANEIDYHPALLSSDDGKAVKREVTAGPHATHTTVKYIHRPPSHAKKSFSLSDSEVSFTDESDGEGVGGNYDESSEEEDTAYDNDMDSVTREDRVEKEEFGHDFKGETLTEDQSKRLLVLIEHASICPGR